MATWQKVVVSGSNISQLNNDSGYLTSAPAATNAFATASVNGVSLLADDPSGTLTFNTSSVSGITITGTPGSDTIDFSLSNIPNSSLTNPTTTIGGTTVTLGGTTTTIDGLTLTGTEASGSFTGSFTGNFVGTTDLPDLTQGEGITAFTYDGSSTATVSLKGATSLTDNKLIKWDNSGNQVENSSITDTGALVTVAVDTTFSTDVDITGDLTVSGTASFQNTENLLVADRFVLFASGSSTTGDGGIVVQQGTQDVGKLYGYDSGANRWGFSSSFAADSSTFTPDVFVGAVEVAAAAPSAAPIYGGSSNGDGTIHVDTITSDIYIYA
jgi:hypothetical protein